VKIYDTASWKVVHGVKYPGPILSLALSADDRHLAAGMTSGLLSLRTRDQKRSRDEIIDENMAMLEQKPKAFQRFMRGSKYKGAPVDLKTSKD